MEGQKKNGGLVGRPFVGFERVRSLAPCRRLAGSKTVTRRVEGAELCRRGACEEATLRTSGLVGAVLVDNYHS